MLSNIKKIFLQKASAITWGVMTVLVFFAWYHYSNVDYVIANYQSKFLAYSDIALAWMMIVLFPLLIAGIVYRSVLFGRRASTDKPSGFVGIVGGIISVLITGLSCCGVSLVSVLGLTGALSFLSIMPYYGMELKALGIILLAYAVWDMYRNLESCKVKKN